MRIKLTGIGKLQIASKVKHKPLAPSTKQVLVASFPW